MSSRVPILCYHAIVTQPQAELPPQWSHDHALPRAAFRAHLDFLMAQRWRVLALSALECSAVPAHSLAITFDDGGVSDLRAAEELQRSNLTATFFVTWSRLGSRSFLSPGQVAELDRHGFTIGSHGMTHARFTELTAGELRHELEGSKQRLECLLGKRVTTVAIPFGSYNSAVIDAAIAAGYRSIATSDFALAGAGSFVLPRLTIGARTTLKDFRSLLTGSRTSIARRRVLNGIRRRLNRIRAMAEH